MALTINKVVTPPAKAPEAAPAVAAAQEAPAVKKEKLVVTAKKVLSPEDGRSLAYRDQVVEVEAGQAAQLVAGGNFAKFEGSEKPAKAQAPGVEPAETKERPATKAPKR